MKLILLRKICIPFIIFTIYLLVGSVSSSTVAAASNIADTQLLTQAASTLGSSDPRKSVNQLAAGIASDKATEEISSWLQNKGKVSVAVSANEKGFIKNSEIKSLFPFYDLEGLMIFTQGGFHHADERHQGNLGMGIRYSQNNWMVGVNTFYDHDFTLEHSRIGVGVEYAHHYMRVSANSYAGLSGWRDDKRFMDYQSHPANGWDIRTEAWLPVYPQLGGKLNYEQYYGSEVALISYTDRQKNPYAVTAGINYTPVPLTTAGIDLKKGKSGASDTQFALNFNYMPGESWSKQISPDAVAEQRSLSGSHYEFVNRNNDIVLGYRKKEVITLGFPAKVSGTELTEVTFSPVVKSVHSVNYLELDASELTRLGGSVVTSSPSAVVLKLPAYQKQGIRLTGVAVDNRGNRSNIAETIIYTTEGAHLLTLDADKTEALADGSDSVSLTIHVDSAAGRAIVGSKVSLKTDAGVLSSTAGKTDASGNYTVMLSSEQPGDIHVTFSEGNQTITHPGIKFITVTNGNIVLDKITARADGKDTVQATLSLRDSTGKPLVGREVNWKTSLGILSASSNKTDRDGNVSVRLISTSTGVATITATVGKDNWISDTIVFENGQNNYSISSDKTLGTSDGTDKITFTVTAENYGRSVMEGEKVSWNTDLGILSDTVTALNKDGYSSVNLSSKVSGTAHVSAKITGELLSATEVKFEKAILSLNLDVSNTTFLATGLSGPHYTLTALNSDGSPAAGETVLWSTDFGILDVRSSVTDSSGKAEAYVYSKTPGLVHMSATIVDQKVNADEVSFLEYLDIKLSSDVTEAKADGRPVKFSLKIKDIDNQPVTGRDVKWSTTIGLLSNKKAFTNTEGISEVTLSSTLAGTGTVTADVNGSLFSSPITFVEDASVEVFSDKTQITSSGYDTVKYTVAVRNTDGTPAAGETVIWSTNKGSLDQKSTVTDSNGMAIVLLTSTETGIVKVTATVKNKTQTAPEVTVVKYIITFLTYMTEGIADGNTPVIITFTAKNDDRSPMPGAVITWSNTGGKLSSNRTITDQNGNATVTLTSSAKGIITVKGNLGGNVQRAAITFN